MKHLISMGKKDVDYIKIGKGKKSFKKKWAKRLFEKPTGTKKRTRNECMRQKIKLNRVKTKRIEEHFSTNFKVSVFFRGKGTKSL